MPSRGSSKLALSWFGPKLKVVKSETIEFRKLSDLEPVLEFLLSCGPLPDLANAQRILPEALKDLDESGDGFLTREEVKIKLMEWYIMKYTVKGPPVPWGYREALADYVYDMEEVD